MRTSSKKTPKVSIGMPIYNGEKYMKEAIDSLLAQTFLDFELIISDNASTDKTEAICCEYEEKDQRIHYVKQSENKGPVENFKFVLDQAVGEYFMWAAHDDLWATDYLMSAIELMTDDSIDFVFPTFELRSISLGIAKKFDPKIFNFIESLDAKWRILNFMSLHYLSHSTNIVYSLFKRKFIKTIWSMQDIDNDGILGLVVLSRGHGAMNNTLFSKRYPTIWPGMLPPIFGITKGWLRKRDVIGEGQKAIETARLRVLSLFPEYESEIMYIYNQYQPYFYNKYYRICSINHFYNGKDVMKN